MNNSEDLMQTVNEIHKWLFHDLADERSRGYFLVDSPWYILALIIAYVYFVLDIGQKWMAKREAFNIKKLLFVFNIFQILANLYVFTKCIKLILTWNINFICFPYSEEDNEFNREIIFLFWFYYMVKISDFLDTIFFVLSKKFNHISFLHVYHHVAMTAASWGGIKYYPIGHHELVGLYNSFVHIFMYSYYLLTIFYSQKKLYGIKKFVTQLQMYQFLTIFLHTSTVFLKPSCNYPRKCLIFLIPNNLMIFLLFYDFYRKTYSNPKPIDNKDQ